MKFKIKMAKKLLGGSSMKFEWVGFQDLLFKNCFKITF